MQKANTAAAALGVILSLVGTFVMVADHLGLSALHDTISGFRDIRAAWATLCSEPEPNEPFGAYVDSETIGFRGLRNIILDQTDILGERSINRIVYHASFGFQMGEGYVPHEYIAVLLDEERIPTVIATKEHVEQWIELSEMRSVYSKGFLLVLLGVALGLPTVVGDIRISWHTGKRATLDAESNRSGPDSSKNRRSAGELLTHLENKLSSHAGSVAWIALAVACAAIAVQLPGRWTAEALFSAVLAVFSALLWVTNRRLERIQADAAKASHDPDLRAILVDAWGVDTQHQPDEHGAHKPEVEVWTCRMGFWNTGKAKIMITGVSIDSEELERVDLGFALPAAVPSDGYQTPSHVTVVGRQPRMLNVLYDTPSRTDKVLPIRIGLNS